MRNLYALGNKNYLSEPFYAASNQARECYTVATEEVVVLTVISRWNDMISNKLEKNGVLAYTTFTQSTQAWFSLVWFQLTALTTRSHSTEWNHSNSVLLPTASFPYSWSGTRLMCSMRSYWCGRVSTLYKLSSPPRREGEILRGGGAEHKKLQPLGPLF